MWTFGCNSGLQVAQGEDYIRRAFLVEEFKHNMPVTCDDTLKGHILNCTFYSLGASQPTIDHQFVFYMYNSNFVRTCFPISSTKRLVVLSSSKYIYIPIKANFTLIIS